MIVYLEITSFRAFALGAEHYYGKLVTRDLEREVRVKHDLTSAQAKRLNQKEGVIPRLFQFKKGMSSDRFESQKELKSAAIKLYRKEFPRATCLLLGNCCVADPQPVLSARRRFKTRANRLVKKWPGWENGKNQLCRELSDSWNQLMEEACTTSS